MRTYIVHLMDGDDFGLYIVGYGLILRGTLAEVLDRRRAL